MSLGCAGVRMSLACEGGEGQPWGKGWRSLCGEEVNNGWEDLWGGDKEHGRSSPPVILAYANMFKRLIKRLYFKVNRGIPEKPMQVLKPQ